ncbi:phage minor capsid protein [Clostridium botulinum]|uniref:phage minor capsid protein n=1 Tax=Clostridium botulinum TaxID=1491 RepID=UPI0013FF3699|nr:phage minor capsid protein [Clostridium botulinum]MBY6916045.1 phage minor capsid protein [Clostridium botulinum]NFQ39504.1 minor capsid protein [Clostridium botulinum]
MALTPDQIAKLPQNIVNMYADLEEFIIQDIARRISNSGQLTGTTEQQLMIAKDLGIDIKEIEEKVADILKKSQKEVDKLFKEAAATSMATENELYKKARMATFDINDSELQAYITAASLQTKKEFKNITGSLGFATKKNGKIVYSDVAKFYQETLDFANMQVVTGVTTRQQAVKRAVKRMTNSGLRYVNYDSGYSINVQDAINTTVRTSANQMCNKLTNYGMNQNIAKEDQYAEVSAHAGARPSHQNWQGRIFKVEGSTSEYDNLYEATELGSAGGLCGSNCKHSYYPFIPNISVRAYSEEDLDKYNSNQRKSYNGKEYTQYEASQRQRVIERSIRQSKREILGYQSAGLTEDMKNSQIMLQQQKKEYKKFCNSMGLQQQNERTQQYGFGRSEGQKARYAK